MLARLFGTKCDHPMADVKSAQALMADFPQHDMLKLAMELTGWIESVSDCEDFKLADQFAVLSLLDEKAQPCARKLQAEYFTLPDLNVFQGNRLCLVLANLSGQIAGAYLKVFDNYCHADKDDAAIKASLPLLAARAVRAIRGRLKYASTHYEPHDENVWRDVARLYRHAEQQRYLEVELALYPGATPSSVKFETGLLMAWYACGINSQFPRSMHLTERIICHYGKTVEITSRLTPQALFGFDLARPVDPVRVNLDATVHPQMRFVSMAGMQTSLEGLIAALKRDRIPPELNLLGVFSSVWVLEAAQHLLTYLYSPPLRASKRLALGGVLNVVEGYENLVGHCHDVGQGGKAYPAVEWSLKDVSTDGFCAVLTNKNTDSVRIGGLLGIQPAGLPRLGVAIVRRLLQDTGGRLNVGAQVLVNQVSAVILRQSVGGGSGNGIAALWLHEKAGGEKDVVRLLMPAGEFSMHRGLVTHFDGKDYLLIPVKLQEKTLDYDLASYRRIEQD